MARNTTTCTATTNFKLIIPPHTYLAAFIHCRYFYVTEANAKGLVFLVALLYRQHNTGLRLQDFENVFVY